MSEALVSPGLISLTNGKILVFGGRNLEQAVNDVYHFNTKTNSFHKDPLLQMESKDCFPHSALSMQQSIGSQYLIGSNHVHMVTFAANGDIDGAISTVMSL
jgi:hypothetical protein